MQVVEFNIFEKTYRVERFNHLSKLKYSLHMSKAFIKWLYMIAIRFKILKSELSLLKIEIRNVRGTIKINEGEYR